jgi:hypothetical protein
MVTIFWNKRRSKIKFILCLINEATHREEVWGSGCTVPHILSLGTTWKSVISFKAWSGNVPPYPFDRRQVGLQSRPGHCGEQKNPCPCRELDLKSPGVQPVAIRCTDWAIPPPFKLYAYYSKIPCGGLLQYLHHSPASGRRWRKGNSLPRGNTGPPCHWGTKYRDLVLQVGCWTQGWRPCCVKSCCETHQRSENKLTVAESSKKDHD